MTRHRILLTRSADDCAGWAETLRLEGETPVIYPCIAIEHIGTSVTRRALELALADADWLVFTSRRGVAACAALAALRAAQAPQIAAVGPATAEAAIEHFGRVDLVGAGGTAAALADELVAAAAGKPSRFVLALAENAPSTLEDALGAVGHTIRVDVYRTVPAPPRRPKQSYSGLASDAVFLASPSAVQGFVNQIDLDIETSVYTIGPSTTAAAKQLGLKITAQAPKPSLEGLLEAMQCRN